ncbi:MAG: hypothetical protein ACERKF_18740 [Vibrio cyclitrophicus]
MNSTKKFKVRLSDYTRNLRHVREESKYLAHLHYQYIILIETVFKHLFNNQQIERKDEFLLDVKIFVDEMISKYSSESPYGYTPRSHQHKLRGLSHDQKLTDKPRVANYDLRHDEWREHDDGYGIR